MPLVSPSSSATLSFEGKDRIGDVEGGWGGRLHAMMRVRLSPWLSSSASVSCIALRMLTGFLPYVYFLLFSFLDAIVVPPAYPSAHTTCEYHSHRPQPLLYRHNRSTSEGVVGARSARAHKHTQ